MTTATTYVNGHRIPKGTWIFVNRWGVHMSARYWVNPDEFRPERFIHGNKVHVPNTFIPFGIG